MVAAETSIEDDRDRNMVVAKTIRTPTAIVTASWNTPFPYHFLLEISRGALLESSSSADLLLLVWRTHIERAALQRYFSLRKTATIVGERPGSRRKRREARLFLLSSAASELTPNRTICPDARTALQWLCIPKTKASGVVVVKSARMLRNLMTPIRRTGRERALSAFG
jgi:hypothetical protein